MSQANSDDMFSDAGGALIEMPADDGEMFQGADEDMGQSVPVPQVNYAKQGFNIYSMLLTISFIFLLIATILFFIEVGQFK
ncbi:MAG: hypothetical protein AAF939_05855 [Planctomycetota bacterium]